MAELPLPPSLLPSLPDSVKVKWTSAYSPFEDDAALLAAHALFSRDGKLLPCMILPSNRQPCPYTHTHQLVGTTAADSVDDILPVLPDDELLCLACNASEDYAIDYCMPSNKRFAARLTQFYLSKLSEWCWELTGFEGFSIARRGMLCAMLQDVQGRRTEPVA
eukprot:scaffold3275_cov183-Ochromonas_danica.AAC.11